MPRAAPTLLLQLGEAPESVRAAHGGFACWFERAFAAPLQVVDGCGGGRAPDPRAFAAILVSGSAASLTRPEPWMDDAAELVRRAHDAGTPLLGVCFGHQLIAHAFGGRVVANARGWEIGSRDIELHDQGARDRLFAGLPRTLTVNLTHEDMVAPDSLAGTPVEILAGNDHTPVEALAVGAHTRGIQFHPEISGSVLSTYIHARRGLLAGLDPDRILRGTVDCPHGVAVLHNFRRHFGQQ